MADQTITTTAARASPASQPIKRRIVSLSLAYGTGPEGEDEPDRYTLTNYRMSIMAANAGTAGMGMATVRVFGVRFDLMNRLSTLGMKVQAKRRNAIVINAGDETDGIFRTWEGTITECWADFNSAPDTSLVFAASAGFIEQLIPAVPTTFPDYASIDVILGDLAQKMGVKFENSSNLKVQLWTPYFWGSLRQQAEDCVRAAGIEWNGIENGVLAIWPRGGHRVGSIPIISADTGLVGYPQYSSTGVIVRSQFNPLIQNGGLIEVKSTLKGASGKYRVTSYTHELEPEMPGGKWFTSIAATLPEFFSGTP